MMLSLPMSRLSISRIWGKSRGVSLIELMVGIAISLIASLVILNVLANNEAQRRASTGASDAAQSGVTALYRLDRIIRMAGAGFTAQAEALYRDSSFPAAWGCLLGLQYNSATVYPRTTAFPSPFAGVDQTNLRVMPILAYDGGGTNNSTPDVLIVMSSQTAGAGRFLPVTEASSGPGLAIGGLSEMGMQSNEFRLGLQQSNPTKDREPCWLDRVDATYAPAAAIAGGGGPAMPTNALFDPPAGAAPEVDKGGYIPFGTSPIMSMYGVNTNAQQLVNYDLLDVSGNNLRVLTENVVNMQVLYGVDPNTATTATPQTYSIFDAGSGAFNWVSPSAAGFTPAALSDGSANAAKNIARILAVRLALVVRSTQPANSTPGPATITLFADQAPGLQSVLTFTADQQRYRYQVYDLVIPIKPVERFLQSYCQEIVPTAKKCVP